MPTTTRTFRVFVSFTFDDLIDERNVLQEHVFPKLEAFCLEKGARFQAVDLRWGVREEAGLDQKTMEICLSEIARCQKTKIKPNFIVLLGDRYGWRPLPARIQKNEFETVVAHIGETGEGDFVESWYDVDLNANPPEYFLKPRKGVYTEWEQWAPVEQRIHRALREGAGAAGLSTQALVKYDASATHQEILKGLGETAEDRAHVFGFFRESAGDEDPDLRKVKDHLTAVLPEGNIFSYSVGDHDRLCNDVERSLKAVVAATAGRFETQNEKASHDRFAEHLGKNFQGRGAVLDAIEQYLKGDDRRPLVVHGPSGSGKSAIMAVASSKRKNAIRRFIGATPESSSGVALLQNLCREMGDSFGQAADLSLTFNELSAMFSRRLRLATAEQPLILFIDALDQLGAQDPAAAMRWLPAELPTNCHVVLSTTEIRAALERAAMIPVEPLPVEDARLALNAWFTEADRTLQPEQREKLLASFLASGLPLYLRLAFEEARLWRSFDPLNECVLGHGLSGIVDRLFARLSDSANHGQILVNHALGYLTAARYGLTEDEILGVLTKDDIVWKDVIGDGEERRHDPPLRQLPVIVWSRLYLDLEPYLTERSVPGGTTVSFYHWQLAERVETKPFHHHALATHFAEQFHWLGANVPNQRKLTELVRQQVEAGLLNGAAALLMDLDFVSAKCAAELVFDLEEDYRVAIAAVPEAQEELREDERRQAELARWTWTLIDSAERSRLPEPKETIKSVAPRSHERIAAESKRVAENPTHLDRLKAFAGFIAQELYPLVEFGTRPGFVVQHAFNSAPAGPVHDAAHPATRTCPGPLILRRWSPNDKYSPNPALRKTLFGHSDDISLLAVTPDASRVVSCDPRLIRLWDVNSGKCLRMLEAKSNIANANAVSLTPDGNVAIFASVSDATVWNLETGECRPPLTGHPSYVAAAAITADGKRAITASQGTLYLWDLQRGQCIRTLEGNDCITTSLSITPDGTLALFNSQVASLARGKWLRELDCAEVLCNCITPNGRTALTGCKDGTVRMWDLRTGRCLSTIQKNAQSVSVTPDGRFGLLTDGSDSFFMWDLKNDSLVRAIRAHSTSVRVVSVTADGRRAISAGGQTIRLWDLEAGSTARFSQHRGRVSHLSANDANVVISAAIDDPVAKVWDGDSGEVKYTLEGHDIGRFTRSSPHHPRPVLNVACLPDGVRAVSASPTGLMKIWDLRSGQCTAALERPAWFLGGGGIKIVSSRRVMWGSDLWDIDSDTCLRRFHDGSHPREGLRCEVDPEGKFVITNGGFQGGLLLWSLQSGTCVREVPLLMPQLTPSGETVFVRNRNTADLLRLLPGSRLALRVDGFSTSAWNLENGKHVWNSRTVDKIAVRAGGHSAVAVSRQATTLLVIDLETGAVIRQLNGHRSRVYSLNVATDGRFAVTTAEDFTLRVWDMEEGRCVAVLGSDVPFTCLSFLASRKQIAVGTQSGDVLFFLT
jgi:WD40 repeat protein